MTGFDKLKAAGKEALIDTYLEFNPGEVIAKLRKVLEPLTPDNLRQLVTEGQAPPIPKAIVESLRGYEDYLGRLMPQELAEWLKKARPDLAETLMELGDSGAEYVVKLKTFFLESIKAPASAEPSSPEEPSGPKPQMVGLHCEACGEDWALPKNKAEQVKSCPFCGVGVEEQTEE